MNADNLTIIPLTEEYLEETKILMERCFDKSLHSIFFLHVDTTLIALENNHVVAGVNLDVYQVNTTVKMGYIGWLYTDENQRGKGVASALIEASIPFLCSLGCTQAAACVEGDNPASFRHLQRYGFQRLSLSGQVKQFGFGLPRVWHHASRFFDMGYFLWFKPLDGKPVSDYPTNTKAFMIGAFANTLLWLPLLFGFSVVGNLAGHPAIDPLAILVPFLTLGARTLAMLLAAKHHRLPVVYHQWDTAYVTALLLPLLVGLPFPVPGNMYPTDEAWTLEQTQNGLPAMALASVFSSFLVFLGLRGTAWASYPFLLLVLDSIPFWYPFCGFNASRLKKGGKIVRLISFFLVLAASVILLVY